MIIMNTTTEQSTWYNFDTGEYDAGPMPGNYLPYLPKDPTTAARGMFECLVALGNSERIAYTYALEAACHVPIEKRIKLEVEA